MSEGANLDSGSFYSSYACYIGIGLSQICSKICPKCFQESPKIPPIMLFRCLHYAPKLPTIRSIGIENLKY